MVSRHSNFLATLLLVVLMVLPTLTCDAQDDDVPRGSFWNNVRFGGGIGGGLGNGFYSFVLAPSAIYDFSDYFSLGVGVNGIYASRRNISKSTIIGGSLIALANPFEPIQLSAEFEQLHVSRNFDQNFVTNPDEDYWYPALFLGAGYRTGNATFGIRYDVLFDEDRSIYNTSWLPFFRFYF